jgi:large subunit ribosomal protein L23
MGLFGKKKTTKDTKKKAAEKKPEPKAAKKPVEKKEAKKPIAKKTDAKKQSMKDLYRETEVKGPSKKGKGKVVRSYGRAYRIIQRPLITEKAATMASDNKYAFAVSSEANKIEIALAVKEVYGIKPVGVNIVKIRGKQVRQGRYTGKRKDWKKAIVTLPKGQSINIYEGV